jgi:DamX protein
LGVSTERAAVGYILAQPNRDELLMFRTLRQGKDWFVVVAGRFSDSASAKAAIENLPTHQAKDVWVRSLGGIQADIRK